jgi:hypothetical protein
VKRTNILAVLGCGLLALVLSGCSSNNHLQSITISAPSQTALTGGVYDLIGDGSTIQLQALGAYSDSKTTDITNTVTWNVIVDPNYTVDAFGNPLPAPGKTIEISPTGLVTAIEPADCTWIDVAPTGQTASWFFVGAYQVTATLNGVTSQPIYVPIASSAGNVNDIFPPSPQTDNNPTEQCGPSSSGG